MSVDAIGGSMAIGGAAAMSAAPSSGAEPSPGLTGQVNPNSAPPPATVEEFLATPMQQAGLQQLADVLGDYSFSKILIVLMMLAAMERDDDKSRGGAAGGFMAGLALASQFGRNLQFDLQAPVQDVGLDGNAGSNINFTA